MQHNRLINPKKMHILSVVAKLQNITRAAEHLCLSQPAISNSLASLEQALGEKLYETVGRSVVITAKGRRLLAHWTKIEACYGALDDEFAAINSGQQGDISIAMVSTAKYFTPSIIKQFSAEYPQVNFHCDVTDRNQIIKKILNHQCALGILTEPPNHPALERIKLGKNPLTFICHHQHPLAQKKRLSFDQLSTLSFVTREHSAQITQNLYKLFAENNREPMVAFTINSTEAVKEAVLENIGAALVPQVAVTRELNANTLTQLSFDCSQLSNDWYLIKTRSNHIDKASQHFTGMAKAYFTNDQ